MANINDLYPSKFLKHSDLRGRTVKLKIARFDVEKIGDDTKPVIYFDGKEKGLVLNKTNAQVVASRYSPETSGWIGKEIELRPDKTQYAGQLVDCIRVQLPAPPAEDGFKEDSEVPF